MKRRIAFLMALVFTFVCVVPMAFAEELEVNEVATDVIEEAPALEEEISEEAEMEEASEEPEEVIEEESGEIVEELPKIEDEEIIEDEIIPDEAEEGEMALAADPTDVQSVADAITAEMLTKDREPAHAVTKNLDMSLNGDINLPDGITVTFASSEESVIAQDGTVFRAIGEDKEVTVTATVTDGVDEATKELDFTVLNMETALLYANNYYYPDLKDSEFIQYDSGSNTIISEIADFTYSGYGTASSTPNDLDTYLYSYPDGYGVNVKRLTGGGACYLDCMTKVSAPEQKKITHSTTLNISNWGAQVKRLDIEIYGTTTKTVSMGKVEINYNTNAITVVPTAGSTFEKIYIAKRLNLDTDYKIDFVVDYENSKFEFLVNGENFFPDSEFTFLTSFKPAIEKVNYYFFRTATDAEFTLKDTVVTGTFDLSDPQVALDMIDESCFTYTDADKITENFAFNVPESVTTLAGLYGFDVTLTSSNTSSIAIDGYNAIVTKGEDKQDVTLTVTVGNADKSVSKTFEVRVHNLAAANMFEAEVPVITDNAGNKDISVDVYCDNLVEGETEAPVYLFAVRKEKESGKIDEVAVDSATLTIGASDTLTASLTDGGDAYDYVVYVWDSFESQKSVINQPPAEPTDLEVTDVTSGTADLAWTRADDDRKAVSSYNIYRDGNYVDTTSSTSYTGENLDFGETYKYEVTAVDDSGLESEYKAEVTATAAEVPTITYVSLDPVAAPNATQTNSDNILHSWAGSNTTLWTRPAVADGRMCHETTVYDRVSADGSISKINSFFYTRSPFEYIDADTRNIVLEVTYFDIPADGSSSETVNFDYQGGSATMKFTNTGYWKTKVIEINNAKFTEAAKTEFTEKYNIRFKATKPGFKVYQTSVVNANEYVRPAASIKMTDALTLRDILVYREDGQIAYDVIDDVNCLKIESGNYLEMDVETISASKRDVCVEVTYYDKDGGSIILDYAGEEGPGMEIISRGDSGEWKTALIRLDDAMFDGSLESSFGRDVDLKLFGDGDTFIKSVRVY